MDGAWKSPRFRKLLAEGRPGQALALVRREMGLSQADFGALLHWDRTHAGRVERGEVGTIFDIRELVRAADALGVPRSALLPILLGPVDPRTIEDGGKGADDMDRRQFGLAATITAMAASAPAPSVPPQVGSGHVAYFQTLTQRMWNHDNHFGGGDIAEFALRQYGSARRLLDHGGYGRDTGLRLLAETSRLARCAGWLCLDAGRSAVARRCYVEAVLMAEQADNDELLANALASLTFLTTDRPTSREPVRLAQRASHLARRIPSARLNAVRSAREAVAHAAIGERQDFEQAMTRAWREVERGLDDVDEPVWLHHVTPFEIRSIEARGPRLLGSARPGGVHLPRNDRRTRHPASTRRNLLPRLLRRRSHRPRRHHRRDHRSAHRPDSPGRPRQLSATPGRITTGPRSRHPHTGRRRRTLPPPIRYARPNGLTRTTTDAICLRHAVRRRWRAPGRLLQARSRPCPQAPHRRSPR